jgi:hypothetical protein
MSVAETAPHIGEIEISPLERTLALLRHEGRQTELTIAANELARAGVRSLAVAEDPESPSHTLANALDKTGVILDRVLCRDDSESINAVSMGKGRVAGLIPLQIVGEQKTLPLHPTGENVIAAIGRRATRGLRKLTIAHEATATDIIMGVIVAQRKV